MMSLVDKYSKLIDESSEACCNGDFSIYEKLTEQALSVRAQFSKSDWETLIAQTSNARAKFEYTRMMNEKFSK